MMRLAAPMMLDPAPKTGFLASMARRSRLLLPLVALLLAGCPPRQPRTVIIDGREVPYEEAAKMSFAKAEDAFAKKDWKTAIELYDAFFRDFPKSTLADDALFRTGLAHEQLNDIPSAGRAYQKLVVDYPSSDFAGEARFRVGIAHFRAEHWDLAEQMLKIYEKRAPEPRKLANARALVAEALERQGNVLDSAPWRLRAAKDLEDPVLAAWMRDKGIAALQKQGDVSALESLATELAGDPAEPAIRLRLAEAKYTARDWSGAAEIARALAPLEGIVGQQAQSLLKRADARERVDPRAIGVVVPLTGDYQAYGQKVLQAILLAANVFGPDNPNARVRVAIRDSAADPVRAAQAVEALFAEEGVVGIVGPLLSNETEAAAPRAQALGLPMVTLAQKKGLTDAGEFVFRNSMTANHQARTIAGYAVEKLGAKRFAIMYPQNAYGEELAYLFWDEVSARGGEVVGIEHYDPKENDFTDEVEDLVGRSEQFIPARKDEWDKIKQAARLEQQRTGKKPKDLHLPPVVDFDALFVPDDYKRVGQLLPFFALADVPIGGYGARNVNMHPVIPLGTSGWNNPELIVRGQRYVEGAVFVDAFYPQSEQAETKRFVEQFVGVFLRVPDILDALAYDTMAVMADRVRDGANSREKLRDSLDGMKGYKGVTGLTGFGKDRDATRDLTLLMVQDKEIRPVGTPAKP